MVVLATPVFEYWVVASEAMSAKDVILGLADSEPMLPSMSGLRSKAQHRS